MSQRTNGAHHQVPHQSSLQNLLKRNRIRFKEKIISMISFILKTSKEREITWV